jgi:hypothetical protein
MPAYREKPIKPARGGGLHVPISSLLLLMAGLIFVFPSPLGASDDTWIGKAPPLPAASGRRVLAENVGQLEAALQQAQPGDSILVADGHYRLSSMLRIGVDDLTLRSASGNRDAVVFDGADLRFGELIGVSDCSGVTIADLTLQNVRWNALKINSDQGDGVHRLTVHNCAFRNIWQRAIKSVQIREPQQAPSGVVIRYCRFSNDRPKALEDDPADKPGASFDGNYVGGIDAMYARNWTISDNFFSSIRGRTGSGVAAIFLWVDSRDSVIERNIIVDCDRGIEIGNAHVPPHIIDHCTGVTVRHNQITRAPIGAITATATRDCRIENNAIHDPENRFRRSIRMVRHNPGLVVAENRIAGAAPQIEAEDRSEVTLRDNRANLPPSVFRNPALGDLRSSE